MPIPHDMTLLRQWCYSTLSPDPITNKPDKAPRQPNGQLASVADPTTWSTFEECVEAANRTGGSVGFVLTPNDPYCIIDLDKTDDPRALEGQTVVWREFDGTYAEYSQSGEGVHIVLRGRIDGGIRRRGLEVYDRGRYMIFTGNAIRDVDVADLNSLVQEFVAAMGGIDAPGDTPTNLPEEHADEEILRMLHEAKNGDKFKDLYYNPPGPGDDWSQRDAALAQMFAFHTRNHEQALRLFRKSVLYDPARKAAKSGYKTVETYEQGYLLGRTFKVQWQKLFPDYFHRQFGKDVAEVLLAKWRAEQMAALHAAQARAQAVEYEAPLPVAENSIPCPPGLVGQVATYVYQTSPSPVWEIAVAVSITFCSAILGNKWRTPTGNGLGHYTVLLAESGTGKTAASQRINALVRAVEENGSALIKNLTGPGFVASGQAILKRFAEQPVMYSYLTEFDATLQRLDPKNASDSYIEFRRVLLEVFDSDRIQATAYAKKDDGTAAVDYPVFSFMGDTRAEDFFGVVNDQFARSGFLARLTLIEYAGPIVPRPVNYRPQVPQELVHAVNDAVLACDRQRNGVATVNMDSAAMLHYDTLDRERVTRMNEASDQLTKGAWNRFDLRVLRLATVIAVGCHPINPVVTVEHLQWAEGIVRWGLERVLGDRVRSGAVGDDNDARFVGDVMEWIDWYRTASVKERMYRNAPKSLAERGDVFPYATFRHMVKARKRYAGHRLGLDKAIDAALTAAVKLGRIDQLTVEQCQSLGYSGRVPVFALGEHYGDT